MILADYVDGMLNTHSLLFLMEANIMNPDQTASPDVQAGKNCCGWREG